MPQVYLSLVVGDGTPRTNPYRPKVFDLPTSSAQVIELPSNPDGSPRKNWVLCVVDAVDFAPIDADPDVLSLTDFNVGLDSTISKNVANKINTFAANLGLTTTASQGETYREFANALLAELGSEVRL